MPAPPAPPGGLDKSGIDQLLQDLSAAFEHLHQRNSDLTEENLALRRAKTSEKSSEKSSTGKLSRRRSDPEALQPKWITQSIEFEKVPQAFNIGHTFPDFEIMPIVDTSFAPLQMTDAPKREEKASRATKTDVGSASEDVQSLRKSKSWRTSLLPSKPESNLTSAKSASSIKSGKTSTGTPRNAVGNVLRKFEALDVRGVGKLYLTDLHRLMEGSGMSAEPICLVNMYRVANNLDPIAFEEDDGGPHLQEFENLTIDFHAFVHLMHDTFPHDKVDEETLFCIDNVRHCGGETGVERTSNVSGVSFESERPAYKRFVVWLETIPSVVIIMNMVVAGLSTDLNRFSVLWDIVEYGFAIFYLCEILVKLWYFGCKKFFCGPLRVWNIFDSACVVVSLAEVLGQVLVTLLWTDDKDGVMRSIMMIKILRLLRLARFVRLLRFKAFNDLKLMVLGVMSGLQVLSWAIVLLMVLTYLAGIAMCNLFRETYKEYETVGAAMFTLFRCWTDGCSAIDGSPLAEHMRKDYGWGFMAFHILTTMFITVGVFNLIMAIFIDNVASNQLIRKHKELEERSQEMEIRFKRLFINYINSGRSDGCRLSKKALCLHLDEINNDWALLLERNVEVTKDMFLHWLEDPNFLHLLEEAEIETANKHELFEVLDSDMGGQLSMRELTTGLMKLRGPVTKADIVAVRLKVRHLTTVLEDVLGFITQTNQGTVLELSDGPKTSRV